MKRILTFGAYDIFHYGHLRIIERASTYGDELIVAVQSDELYFNETGTYPLYTQQERINIIESLDFVNEAFLQKSSKSIKEYILENNIDLLVMGCDWTGKLDDLKDIIEIVYLPRTPDISTSELKEKIKEL
jgi:glycerol-3-phosphate cytidylyltransferase